MFLLPQDQLFKNSISITTDKPGDTAGDASGPIRGSKPEADDCVSQSSGSMVGYRGQTSTDHSTELASPPKTPSSVSLAESTQSASHSELTHIWNVFLDFLPPSQLNAPFVAALMCYL